MDTATPAIQNLARRLIALEAARESADELVGAAVRTCDKLRTPLMKLAGVAGFRSIMTRALALATAEVAWLNSVHVRPDGSLEGFDAASLQLDEINSAQAGVGIVAQLLGLLVVFIGEPLTLRLVRDAWPEVLVTGTDAGSEEGL